MDMRERIIYLDPDAPDIPPGSRIRSFSFSIIPLTVVVMDGTPTLLMRPALHSHRGFDVAALRQTWPEGPGAGLAEFTAARRGLEAVMAGAAERGFEEWHRGLKEFFEARWPGSGISLKRLTRELCLDFGHRSEDADFKLSYRPLEGVAPVLYLVRDERTGDDELCAAFFLGLDIHSRDTGFLEGQDLEFVPLDLLARAECLHPRYAIHPAVAGFFTAQSATAVLNRVPRIEWQACPRAEDTIVMAADFSYYYREAESPRAIVEALSEPYPGTEPAALLSAIRGLEGRLGSGPDFAEALVAKVEDYLSRLFMRAGFFVDTPTPGIFAGLAETAGLRTPDGCARLYSYQALLEAASVFLKCEIIVDRVELATVGPVFNDPRRWFNLGRDRIPFDIRALLRVCKNRLQASAAPPIVDGRPSYFQRKGLYLAPRALEWFRAALYASTPGGGRTEGLEAGSVYRLSADDPMLGYVEPEPGAEGALGMVAWRQAREGGEA